MAVGWAEELPYVQKQFRGHGLDKTLPSYSPVSVVGQHNHTAQWPWAGQGNRNSLQQECSLYNVFTERPPLDDLHLATFVYSKMQGLDFPQGL